ncbi:SDR family NAD(P)-dependent oxidoreductase [Burkholderia sp. R-69980]|nr:SDR family NAD(P)-dependent oxidoreductase [Burkholderia sp. R-69980]
MMSGLNGKVVAVTGGFGSLGLAVAQVLASRGARVALIDRAAAPNSGVLPSELADAYRFGDVDLGVPEAAQKAIDTIVGRLGGLDALVNIAGGFRWETLAEGSVETWDLMYQMNVKTALNASKAALRHLLASDAGRIVNISAGAALKAGTGMGAYSASKAGVARLTEALAEEMKDKGVTVNAVLPSIIDTRQNRADMPDADFSRWVAPENIGAVIAFLLSSDADAITGALIPVAGRV